MDKTTQDRIEAEAKHRGKNHMFVPMDGDYSSYEFHGFIVERSYIAGATAENSRAQLLVKTLKQVEYHLLLAKNKPNNTDYKGLVEHLSKAVTEALEQWKGKPDHSCPHCGKELARDRNLCCRECGKEVAQANDKCRCIQPNWNAFTGRCLTCGKQ